MAEVVKLSGRVNSAGAGQCNGAAMFDLTETLEIPLIDGSPWEDVQWDDLVRQLHEALNPARLLL